MLLSRSERFYWWNPGEAVAHQQEDAFHEELINMIGKGEEEEK